MEWDPCISSSTWYVIDNYLIFLKRSAKAILVRWQDCTRIKIKANPFALDFSLMRARCLTHVPLVGVPVDISLQFGYPNMKHILPLIKKECLNRSEKTIIINYHCHLTVLQRWRNRYLHFSKGTHFSWYSQPITCSCSVVIGAIPFKIMGSGKSL